MYQSKKQDKGKPDKLKIQKLAYYAQAWSMVFYDKPLFNETIEAWKDGPAIPSVHRWAKDLDFDKDLGTVSLNIFTESERYVMDEVLRVYGDLSSTTLRALTHRETPWVGARGFVPKGEHSTEQTHS